MKKASMLAAAFVLIPCIGQAGAEAKKKAVDALKEACRPAIEKDCKEVQPGRGRLTKCLNEHKADLSDSKGARQEATRRFGRQDSEGQAGRRRARLG